MKVEKWDVRVASPRKLHRALHDFLTDNEYKHEYEPLQLEEGKIEGTATFQRSLIGQRDVKRRRRWGLLIVGVFLCLLIVLIPIGLWLIRRSGGKLRTKVVLDIEGEVYRARGTQTGLGHTAEVLDVVADARITLKVEMGRPDNEDVYRIAEPTKDKKELETLTRQVDDMEKRLRQLLPRIVLPEVRSLS